MPNEGEGRETEHDVVVYYYSTVFSAGKMCEMMDYVKRNMPGYEADTVSTGTQYTTTFWFYGYIDRPTSPMEDVVEMNKFIQSSPLERIYAGLPNYPGKHYNLPDEAEWVIFDPFCTTGT
ncbi:hypothetical protein MGU_08453 [Metarhizium guizhouense ARSEF 977]|uniref:Uncharacterized protein n=1 Tax=Metarhizium guizhouense (strain ARSEF 977) TaxID=1276136 RepID=A0A0B4GXC6_METGA|nr:hypothetical protein MGU_08453 [Metarhizium guizhouense ARSEF 977]